VRRLASRCLDHPRLVVGVFAAMTLAWFIALPRLHLETDGRALFDPGHPALEFEKRIDREHATGDFVVVAVSTTGAHGVFTPAVLNGILRLTHRLQELPGAVGGEVRSLATVATPAWTQQGLALSPPLTGEVRSQAEATAVRAVVEADPLLPGVLVSKDRRGAAIYVPIEAGADRRRLIHSIRELAAEELGGIAFPGERPRAYVLGPAAAESLLGEHVLRDLAVLLPLALAVVVGLFWLWFRGTAMAVVGLGEALAVVTWSLGLLAATGGGVSLVTVVMPVILATYGMADTVHIAHRFREKLSAGPGRRQPRAAMEEALDEIFRPVVFTSLTTGLGFLAFATSPIPPLRDFGLFTAFGIFCSLGVSLLVIPSALLLAPGAGRLVRDLAPGVSSVRWLQAAVGAASRHRVAVLTAFALASVLISLGTLRLKVQDSWIHNFSPRSELVQADGWFNRNFLGSNVLRVVLDSGEPEAAHQPEFLRELDRLQAHLARMPEVGGSLSLADQLAGVGRAFEGSGRLPQSWHEVGEWMLLHEIADGRGGLARYVDPTGRTAVLWVFLNHADYRRSAAVLAAVQSFRWQHGSSPPDVHFAGDAYLGFLLVDSIARAQRTSLVGALVAILILVFWMQRSVTASVLAVLPVSLAVLWNFGFMGWVGLPLGVATSTFSAISIGMGVDFALHWLARERLALQSGASWEEAQSQTAASTGGAVLLQGVSLLLGFGILLLSSTPPNRHLGALMCVNILACVATTLFLLPAAGSLGWRWRQGVTSLLAATREVRS
jgi:predicted RND superfamily exporter protein